MALELVVSIDDGHELDMQVAELLVKHKLPGIFYVPAFWESYNTYKGWRGLTKQQLLEISDLFEIGSHGLTHDLLTRMPLEVAKWEISRSKDYLEQGIGKAVNKFCYPRGYANDYLKKVVAEYYESGRNVLVGTIEQQPLSPWMSTTVHAGCERTEYDGVHWYDYAVKKLEQAARKKNGYFHVWLHSHEIERNNGWNGLERLFQLMSQYR